MWKLLGLNENKRDLLWQFTKTSFQMRYQNALLGVLWVLIKPYATFVVMLFLWSKLGRDSIPNYTTYLLLGVVFYSYFNELLAYGNMALVDKAHIILKVNFPRQIAVISSMFTGLINLGINLVLVLVVFLITGVQITLPGVLYFLFVTLTVFVFGLGVTLFSSIINVRFRDLKNIFDLGLFLLYWVTPIFIVNDSSLLGSTASTIMTWNPVGFVLNQARAAFGIYGQIDFGIMFGMFVVSVIIFLWGWYFFEKNIKFIAEYF